MHAEGLSKILVQSLALDPGGHRRREPHSWALARGRADRRLFRPRWIPGLGVALATLGIVGKWAIQPSLVALANEAFTPSKAALGEARDILMAMEDAKMSGAGATIHKGRLVDIASIRQAEVIVHQARIIAGG